MSDLSQKPILLGALLVLVTLVLYSPVAHHGFLTFFDDDFYVTQNIHVSTGLNAGNVRWAFTSFYEANWHPVTWLSHMADCQLFGLNPGPQHLVNVVLHAVNALLLFLLLHRATGAIGRSFLVAALFAVHPLNVETVAWIAERKSLLCMLFSLLTLAAYGRYVRQPNWKTYLPVAAALALALMSKPMAVSLPLVLLLLDYWPLERYEDLSLRPRWTRLAMEKLPLFCLSAASCIVTIAAQRGVGAMVDVSDLPLSVRLENAAVSYVLYIGKTFWPSRLAVFYPHPWHGLAWPEIAASVFILAAITAGVAYFRRARYLVVGWFLFVITLIPVIGIVQVGRQAMADRYAYVPTIGLFMIVAWGAGSIANELSVPRAVPAVSALALILALATVTSRDLPYWQSGVELFTRAQAVAGQPDFVIEEGLAESLVAAGRLDEALPHYREACGLRPTYARCHYKMAELLLDRRQLREALEEYELLGSQADNKDIALLGLTQAGEILLDLGDYQGAELKFLAALRVDPNNSKASLLLERARQGEEGKSR